MQTVVNVVIAILAFCVIIIIHELGHFTAAKLCGIQVNEFALGMGPVIFRKKGKETEYVIRALPIGGSCSMEGEDAESANPRAFASKPVWQRMIVIVAGPVMNLVLGFFAALIYVCAASSIGTTTVSIFPEQGSLCSNILQVGDEIVAVENTSVWTTYDIQYKMQTNNAETDENGNLLLDFKVKRNGEVIELTNVPFMVETDEDGNSSIIYGFYVEPLERNFFTAVEYGARWTISISRMILFSLADLFKGKYGLKDLSGAVGSVNVVAQSISYGFAPFMYMFAFITVNVGIFNLLPIPALDGCRFLFLLVEAIRRKPLKPEVEGMVHLVGFGLLMLLMLVVTFGDISKLVSGGF